jgi:hypothetical protein
MTFQAEVQQAFLSHDIHSSGGGGRRKKKKGEREW